MTWVPWQPFRSDWNRRYIPSRGLAYSFVLHEIALFACFSYSIVATQPIVLKSPEQEIHSAEVLYLPTMGGGDSGGHEGARGSEGEGASASGVKREGITFRGPQRIRSDSPNPDNNLQTILQPALSQAPTLNFPLQVPNIIRVARPKPQDVAAPKIKLKASIKDVPLPTPTEKPVLKAEAQIIATPLRSETVPLLALPELKPQAVEKKPQPEKLVVTPEQRTPPPPVVTADASLAEQSLAVLNAVQIVAPKLMIPPGERHASFEVSPSGTATAHGADSRAGVPGGKATGEGAGEKSGAGRVGVGAGGRGSAKVGIGSGKTGSGTGSGGSGSGSGQGAAGRGSGAAGHGDGNGPGNGRGNGNGNGRGAGNGSGSGPGEGPFPGIQVIGGAGSGLVGAAATPAPAPSGTPRNYDFSIVASGGSGGGLKDFGVFRNEAVYTVYMDMSDIAPTSQSWVLQYADSGSGPRTAAITLGADGSVNVPQAMLEPPYAMTKQLPKTMITPPNNAMTIITGIITREGKFENARILQAPTEEIGHQWADCLSQWSFRPGAKAGLPVAVRVLIGIPVF